MHSQEESNYVLRLFVVLNAPYWLRYRHGDSLGFGGQDSHVVGDGREREMMMIMMVVGS